MRNTSTCTCVGGVHSNSVSGRFRVTADACQSIAYVHTYSGVQQSYQRSLFHCSLVVLVMAEVLEVWLREGPGGGGGIMGCSLLIECYTGNHVCLQS